MIIAAVSEITGPEGYIIVGAIAVVLWIGFGIMVWKTKKLW